MSTPRTRPPTRATEPPARSLAEDLRRRGDDALAALIAARPDLARPAPADITTLAARALTPAALRQAIDSLDTAHLRTLEAVAVVDTESSGELDDTVSTAGVAARLGSPEEHVDPILTRLSELALLVPTGDGHAVPRAVREALGPVAGLAAPHPDDARIDLHRHDRTGGTTATETTPQDRGSDGCTARGNEGNYSGDDHGGGDHGSRDQSGGDHGSRDQSGGDHGSRDQGGGDHGNNSGTDSDTDVHTSTLLETLTEGSPAGASGVLERLTWGPPTGVVDPAGPVWPAVRWLLDRGLVRESGGTGSVTLPRPVALALRGGRLYRSAAVQPPACEVRHHEVDRVDAGAGVGAGDVLSLVEAVAGAWGETPPRVLRAGGLAVRDLANTVTLTGLPRHDTALLLEVMWAAGLIGQDGGLDPAWAPTRRYDAWIEQPDDIRWAELCLAWRDMPRAAHRIGTGGVDGTINALAEGATWGLVPRLRRRTLQVVLDAGPGAAMPAPDVVARLRWELPRLDPAVLTEAAEATLAEASMLGLLSAGAASSAARALLHPEASVESVAAAVRLPEPVRQVILQADLTAIAPGRLTASEAAFMRTAADVESRGAAAVYRFGPHTLTRLFDAGWSAQDALDTLARMSTTGVPQPLEYLVQDAWRRHGRARVGSAATYVRSDDVASLDALMALPEASTARLRRLAPTVLVSPVAPTRLLALLRDWGVHALAEGADGTVISGAAAPARAPDPRRRVAVAAPVDAAALVATLRAGEARRAHTTDTDAATDATHAPADDPTVIAALLRRAAADCADVWIGVVGTDGDVTRRHVRPDRVSGGLVHGTDLTSGRQEVWPVHRITGVRSPDADAL